MAGQTSFADFYSLDDLEQYKAAYEAWPRTDAGDLVTSGPVYDAWRPSYSASQLRLEEAFHGFLCAKIAACELQSIPFSKGRNHSFADDWNLMVGVTPDDDEVDQVDDTGFWRNRALERMADRLAGAVGAVCVYRSYEEIIAQVNAGTFEHFFLDSSGQCTRTGIRLKADIGGWQARLGMVDRSPRSQGGTALILLSEEAPGAAVHHLTIPVPSGQLLLADWFRIPEFTSVVNTKDFSVNLACERVAQTRHYAQDHGFASVFVGNSSPSIVSRDGTLAIGNEQDPDEGFDGGGSQGDICTDLWWATAIDRQVLEAIVARGLIAASADAGTGAEALSQADAASQAQDKVREYLRDNDVTQLDLRAMGLPPGQSQQGEPVLNLYFSDANDRLTQFRADYVHTQDFDPLSLVLSPRELVWRNRDGERDIEHNTGESEPNPHDRDPDAVVRPIERG